MEHGGGTGQGAARLDQRWGRLTWVLNSESELTKELSREKAAFQTTESSLSLSWMGKQRVGRGRRQTGGIRNEANRN